MFPSHWLSFVSFNFPTTARVSVLSKTDSDGDYKNQSLFYYVESDHWKPPRIPGRILMSPELSFPPDSHPPAVARSPNIFMSADAPTR